ncbi:MAG: hypothetical protein J5685_10660, partial [Clostridiales bacterium]|nr:hypothetical protein [Clostridiales bacterium]
KEERNQELEYVVLFASKYMSEDKPTMLADIYLSYINQEIELNEFVSYAEVLDRFLPGDSNTLMKESYNNIDDSLVSDSLLRLVALGLFVAYSKDVKTENTLNCIHIPANSKKDYILTDFGRKMKKCLSGC